MAKASESLERAEHAAHAGGGHGHGHGHHEKDALSMRIGITMAILGVLLAFAAARVGYERAELLQYLIDQEHAHAKYQAQDIKHRTAVLSLMQLHAFAAESKINPSDMIATANSVTRYLAESEAAKLWVDSYDPIVAAHSHAQEEYEHGQLAAELGIVLASIALLLKNRIVWGTSAVLGAFAIVLLGMTYQHTSHALAGAETKMEEAEKNYRTLRDKNKTTDVDNALVDEVLKTYGPK